MNKKIKILLALAVAFSTSSVAAVEDSFEPLKKAATPPLTRLTNVGTDQGLIFEVRSEDLDFARSKARVEPIIYGRVRGIRKIADFSNNFNNPSFSIATFKVVGNTEQWVATTNHRFRLKKNAARFRLPLVGLREANTKYRFYVLTDAGATFAGPFEASFNPSDSPLITSETDNNQFPDDVPSGFTKEQLDSIAQYILQRLTFAPQSYHSDLISGVQLAPSTNNFVVTLPTKGHTLVRSYKKPVRVAGTDGNGSTTGSAGVRARGDFSNTASYIVGDIVSSDSSSFIANGPVPAGTTAPTRTNISTPSVAQYWTLLVAGPNAVAPVTVVNNTTTVTPQGTYNSTLTYKKGDTIMFGGSTFLAQQDIAAGVIPDVNNSSQWALLATGTPITVEEDVLLPGNGTIQVATLTATNPMGGSNSPATVIALKSSTNSVIASLKFSFSGGNLTPISYEVSGVTTSFGGSGPAAPVSNGTALNIPGQDYSVFFASNKINLKNKPLLGSFTAKTINVEYKAF